MAEGGRLDGGAGGLCSAMHFRSHLVAPVAVALACAGCTVGGSSTVAAENDRLRREVMQLNEKVAELEGERTELATKLGATGGGLSVEAVRAMPVVTDLEIGMLSGFAPSDRVTPATRVDVYVTPRDGRGRFMQAVGTLRVVATGGGGTLASATLTPGELREAYRAGIMGTHYTIEMPLSAPVVRDPGPDLVLHVEFDDAVTGKTHRTERTIVHR